MIEDAWFYGPRAESTIAETKEENVPEPEQVVVKTDEVSPVLGWLDVGMRAFKTALQVFITALPIDGIFSLDVGAAKIAFFTAGSAGASIILNSVLSWTRKP